MSSVCIAREQEEEIIFIALVTCMPLPSSVNDRDVRKMGPSAKQTEQKKKKRPIINHFSSSSASLHHPIMPAFYKQHANRCLINTSCIRSHPSTTVLYSVLFLCLGKKEKGRPFFSSRSRLQLVNRSQRFK